MRTVLGTSTVLQTAGRDGAVSSHDGNTVKTGHRVDPTRAVPLDCARSHSPDLARRLTLLGALPGRSQQTPRRCRRSSQQADDNFHPSETLMPRVSGGPESTRR